jgi:hypothetical protein
MQVDNAWLLLRKEMVDRGEGVFMTYFEAVYGGDARHWSFGFVKPGETATNVFFSGGIRTKIGRCTCFVTLELELSSYFLIWAASE